MFAEHVGKIHSIQLVTGNNEVMGGKLSPEVHKIFPDRIRRAFIPAGVCKGLLGSQHFCESIRERVKNIRLGYVKMQGR